MKLRDILLPLMTVLSGTSFAQGDIRLDASFIPELRPQTTFVRSVLPLGDGRIAAIEFWEDAYFENEMGCLHANGTRDLNYAGLSGALQLFPLNEGAFYSWQNYSGERINRHHVLNGVVDNDYHTADAGAPGLYEFSYSTKVNVDQEGRIYLISQIQLTDTADGLLGYPDIIRLDDQGALDTTFPPAESPGLFQVLPLSDGRLLMGGGQTQYNGVPVGSLFTVNAEGSVNDAFHPSFIRALPMSVLPTADGGLILTGQFIDLVSLIELDTTFVVKLLPDGTRDPLFNSHLKPYQQRLSGRNTCVNSIVPWGDGYLIAGNFDQINGEPKRGIAMIDANGLLENVPCTWPGPGLMPDEYGDFVSISLVLDGQGGALAYGGFVGFDDGNSVSSAKGLVRFVPDDVGIADASSGNSTATLYPSPTSTSAWLAWDARDPLVSALLYDATGRCVRPIAMDPGTCKAYVDLRDLRSGEYIVRARHRSGSLSILRTSLLP